MYVTTRLWSIYLFLASGTGRRAQAATSQQCINWVLGASHPRSLNAPVFVKDLDLIRFAW
jgi:hypothetical protein